MFAGDNRFIMNARFGHIVIAAFRVGELLFYFEYQTPNGP